MYTSPIQKAQTLEAQALVNEKAGNLLLATWMRQSAEHQKALQKQLDKDLKPRKHEVIKSTRKQRFTSDWYKLEEETLKYL